MLYEDNHLLAVAKPAGLLVQGAAAGETSLFQLVKERRKERERKPGGVYLGLLHRLDRETTGVVLFAKTSKAASRLSRQFRAGSIRKTYWAVVDCPLEPGAVRARNLPDGPSEGFWEDWLVKDGARNLVSVTSDPQRPGAKHARTRWRLLAAARSLRLLELKPETGRSHQLRVQAANRGMPIHGDRKYGSRHVLSGQIALHAASLETPHPTATDEIRIDCPRPATWDRFPFRFPPDIS